MKNIKKMLPYLLVLVVVFYVPLLFADSLLIAVLSIFLIVPSTCLFLSLLYGVKNGFSILYVALGTLLYVPNVFVFWSADGAKVANAIYGVLILAGNGWGMLYYQKEESATEM